MHIPVRPATETPPEVLAPPLVPALGTSLKVRLSKLKLRLETPPPAVADGALDGAVASAAATAAAAEDVPPDDLEEFETDA